MDWKNNIIADENARIAAAESARLFTEQALIDASNKGTYKRALKDLDALGKIVICAEDDGLSVSMDDTVVRLKCELSKSVCSCAAKIICRHVVAAAIAATVICEGMGTSAPTENEAIKDMDKADAPQEKQITVDMAYLNEIAQTVGMILSKGIIHCTQTDSDTLIRLSLRGGPAYKSIANMCRSLSEEIHLMELKNAEFSPSNAATLVCRLCNTAYAMMNKNGEALLHKTTASSEGNGNFICMGIYPRHSKSGYAGITAVCYEKELGDFFTYNITRADFYSSTAIREHWIHL